MFLLYKSVSVFFSETSILENMGDLKERGCISNWRHIFRKQNAKIPMILLS